MDTARDAAGPADPLPDTGSRDAVTGRQHFAGLDGLRGVAALVVVIGHSLDLLGLPYPPHFFLAVDFFFLLSGFVVAFAYEQRLTTGSLSVRQFVAIRLVRLHPLLVLGIAIALAGRILQTLRESTALPLVELLIATVCGVLCIPYHVTAGDPAAFTLNLPQWSLFAEYLVNIAFALLIPWLLMSRLIALVAVGAVTIVAILAFAGTLNVGSGLSDWPLSLTRVLFPFFLGVLFARLHRNGRLPRMSAPWLIQAFVLAGILAMPVTRFDQLVQFAAVALIFPLIIVSGCSDRPQSDTASAMLWIGALSYPIYILHYPIVRGIARIASAKVDPSFLWWIVPAQLGAVLILSQLALKLFDEPVRRRLDPRRRR